MEESMAFSGFSPMTVRFFKDLARHNSKEWFEQHRDEYETTVLSPAKAFVTAMGERLRREVPNIRAEPRVNGSIFRIFRDVRFSKDKSPYKTNLGIYFWQGNRSRWECSGFYFHLEPPILLLGAGVYKFSPHLLDRFRRAAADPETGDELVEIISAIADLKGYTIGGKAYKRIPPGLDAPSAEAAALLLHGGLWAGVEVPIPDVFYSPQLIDYCSKRFLPLLPLHRWLMSLTTGAFRP